MAIKDLIAIKRKEFLENLPLKKWRDVPSRRKGELQEGIKKADVVFFKLKNSRIFTKEDFIEFLEKHLDEPIDEKKIFSYAVHNWCYESSAYKRFFYTYTFYDGAFGGSVMYDGIIKSPCTIMDVNLSDFENSEGRKVRMTLNFDNLYNIKTLGVSVDGGKFHAVPYNIEKKWNRIKEFIQGRLNAP
ncbi:MAG: hypothetical protein LBR70_03895 [Lactobacillaceae bacterium]|jgi:hypothetical protein|nr:hypothetical protein [Lactobacillaceae bacterium]